jgi:hypothetical protein
LPFLNGLSSFTGKKMDYPVKTALSGKNRIIHWIVPKPDNPFFGSLTQNRNWISGFDPDKQKKKVTKKNKS